MGTLHQLLNVDISQNEIASLPIEVSTIFIPYHRVTRKIDLVNMKVQPKLYANPTTIQ
jgi:hypothetical protein